MILEMALEIRGHCSPGMVMHSGSGYTFVEEEKQEQRHELCMKRN
jgi:hypothetical protein